MDKMDFMNTVKDIFEETEISYLETRAEEMKHIIDCMLEMELSYVKAGIRQGEC